MKDGDKMKHVKFSLNLFSKNWISNFVLLFIITASLFTFVYAIGNYQYCKFSLNLYESTKLNENDYYFMPFFTDKEIRGSGNTPGEAGQKFSQQVKSISGVADIVKSPLIASSRYKGRNCPIVFYDRALLEKFSVPLESGHWFDLESKGPVQAVVGGNAFLNLPADSSFSIEYTNKNGNMEKQMIQIVGKLKMPACYPNFSLSGTDVQANDLWGKSDVIILNENTPIFTDAFKSSAGNFFVSLQPNRNHDVVLSEIQKIGTTVSYHDLLMASKTNTALKIKRNLPMPLFLLFIVTMAQLSISVLFVDKKLSEFGVYYLYGCTKREYFCYLGACIGTIGLLAVLIVAIILLAYPFLSYYGVFNFGNVILDFKQLISFILPYELVSLLLSLAVSILSCRRSSPLQVYRRLEQ